MFDLTAIDQDTLIARGQYSTVRAAHEDAKHRLAVLCGQFSTTTSQVLRAMQPDGDAMPNMDAVHELLATARESLRQAEQCVIEIEGLALQRVALKPAAWGRK